MKTERKSSQTLTVETAVMAKLVGLLANIAKLLQAPNPVLTSLNFVLLKK